MNILIYNKDIYKLTPFNNLNQLKTYILAFVKIQLKQMNISLDAIENIIFTSRISFVGKLEVIRTEPLKYDIYLQLYLIRDLLCNNINDKIARSIIIHELFHCKENLITFSIIEYSHVCKDSYNYNDLCVNLGYHQWSEYYAHFNSSKICLSSGLNDDKIIVTLLDSITKFKKDEIFSESEFQVFLYENNIHPFIRNSIILIANYNQTQNKEIVDRIKKYTELNNRVTDYFEKISNLLKRFYLEYPNNVSYENFAYLGEQLLEI